jgi:hypothetical protein
MIDKARRLVTRVDLYGNYLIVLTLIVSMSELPLLMWRLDLARYVLPLGWLIMLLLGTKRMWRAKTDNNLTSKLQLHKVIVGLLIVAGCAAYPYHFIGSIGVVHVNGIAYLGKLVLVLNGVVGLGVYAAGVIVIWLVDAFAHETFP